MLVNNVLIFHVFGLASIPTCSQLIWENCDDPGLWISVYNFLILWNFISRRRKGIGKRDLHQ